MNRKSVVVFIITVVCVVLVSTAAAQSDKPEAAEVAVGTAFTYQGQLKKSGSPHTGQCNFQFSLWDALSGGAQKGSTQTATNVQVTGGLFIVPLNFGDQFQGDARYLQAAVQCAGDSGYTALSPRTALNPAPYALSLRPGAQTQGNIPGLAGILRATNTGEGAALLGLATSNTGATYGVLGNAFSPNGFAVLGYADGGATAVQGWSDSSGVGVWGRSATGAGVYGDSANLYGVHGLSQTGIGAYGQTTSGWGVYGQSQTGVGVYGESTSFEGVRGTSHNVNHGGVVGVNDAAGGIAVYGVTPNGGYAGYFQGNVQVAGNLSTGGNVGMGTTNPLTRLHVKGNTASGVDNTAVFENSAIGPNASHIHWGTTGNWYIRSASASGQVVIQDTGGNVGIGAQSATDARVTIRGLGNYNSTTALRVLNSSGQYMFAVRDDGAVGVPNRAHGSSSDHVCILNDVLVYCNSAAEYVPSIDDGQGYPETADVVSMSPQLANRYGDTHSPFAVQKSATPCDPNLLGFITDPEKGADGEKKNDHYLPLAIYGYFPAKVTLENGAIQRGDPLTSSSKPGYAMKATQACKIIGYALDDANAEGTIQVFAHLSENSAPEVASLREQMQQKDAQIEAQQQQVTELKQQVETMQQQNAALDQRLTSLEQIASKDSGATPSLNTNWLLVGGIAVFGFVLARRGQKER